MEATWLAAAAVIPLFFSVSSVQTFEPDKVMVLQFLAVFSGTALILKKIAIAGHKEAPPEDRERWQIALKHPLFIFIIALALAYVLSSIFSLVPTMSWWGSYRRAQGSIAFLCYVVLFLVVVDELRTLAQLRRLQYVIILTSLPAAAYAILQDLGSDPLPWSNPMIGRASGSMGNPIFLGAYLLFVIPLTVGRLMDGFRRTGTGQNRNSSRALILCGSIALALQVMGLLSTQSRGPVYALLAAAYISLFLFLVLNRGAGKIRPAQILLAAVSGLLLPLLMAALVRVTSGFPRGIAFSCLGLGGIGCIAGYVAVWRSSGWRGALWLVWLAQTLTLIIVFVLGPARIMGEHAELLSSIGRFGQLSDGSASVRLRLWQTGWNAFQSGSQAALPTGVRDPFHFVRTAVGNGPESIWYAANYYVDPELVRMHQYERVDRMHSEMFDNLLSLGFIGVALYLLVIAAVFYCVLQYFGFLSEGRHRIYFIFLSAVGCMTGIVIPWAAGRPYLAGIGVQAGLLAGVFAYIAWNGFRSRSPDNGAAGRFTWVLCILTAVTAHFLETGVGIAVTTTRTYFFICLAILFVTVTGDLKEEPKKRRKPKTQRWFQNPLLPLGAAATFVVLTGSWCFIINTTNERSTIGLFLRTWFSRPPDQEFTFILPGTLTLLILMVSGGLCLMYAERPASGMRKGDFAASAKLFFGLMVLIWLAVGLLTAFFWTALEADISAAIDIAKHAEARITVFYAVLLLLLLMTTLVLRLADTHSPAAVADVRKRIFWLGPIVVIVAFIAVAGLSVRPAWADITSRIAVYFQSTQIPESAVALHKRTVELAPQVIPYYVSLSLAQSRAGASSADNAKRESWIRDAMDSVQKALDLNPLDPVNHRTLASVYLQLAELTPDSKKRETHIREAISALEIAIRLAPNYPDALNETGRCYFLLGDHSRAIGIYEKSLQMSPGYAQTHMYMGEAAYRLKQYGQALQHFTRAAKMDSANLEARKNVGFVLALLGRKEEAIEANLETLKKLPEDPLLLRRLASLYFGVGDYNSGIDFAHRAYDVMPQSERGELDDFIQELQVQGE